MSMYISHQSALEFWQTTSPEVLSRALNRKCKGASLVSLTDTRSFDHANRVSIAHLSSPLHVLVSTAAKRSRADNVVSHVVKNRLPRDSFCQVDHQLYVASPELCFVQMAPMLSLVQLALLGLQFCGTYTNRDYDAAGFEPRDPLTNKTKLESYINRAGSLKGTRQAHSVLKWIANNSASPMESGLMLLLCLPGRLGGYGFQLPELNYKIEVHAANKKMADRLFYVCDLYWPQQRLDVEYDSKQWHSTYERAIKDSDRRDALMAMGIQVETISPLHLRNAIERNRKAHQIGRALGKRVRTTEPSNETVRRELIQVLLNQTFC